VANKIIDGKQCTIVWHVDDLKISHIDPKVNTTILNLLDAKYGQEIVAGKRAPLTINRGKNKHDFLGMIMDYSEAGYVKIDMCANLQKFLEEMLEDMDGTANSPAADHLFQIVDGIEDLDEPTKEFHCCQAPLLM
jgi:hypothetical protein